MEPLVLMTAIISSVTAHALTAAQALLQLPYWATSISGFGYRIRGTGTARPSFMVLPPPGRPPLCFAGYQLAAYGYLLTTATRPFRTCGYQPSSICEDVKSILLIGSPSSLIRSKFWGSLPASLLPPKLTSIENGSPINLRGVKQSQFHTPL